MKLNNFFYLIILAAASFLTLNACIKSEGKNVEADIVDCELPGDILKTPPTIENRTVMMLIMAGTKKTTLAPTFTLSPGATIEPASGTARDFTMPQVYTVTSEDGKWKKDYTITITDAELPLYFSFDNWFGTGKYENPFEFPQDTEGNKLPEKMQVWSSGNAGYALIHSKDFPTSKSYDSYETTFAARLETKKTGFAPLPLAAGNLFLGTFDGASAMKKPLESTRFGIPFGKKPKKISGYYKYKPGPEYKKLENGKQIAVPEKIDECNIYAVYYYKDKPGTQDDDTGLLHGGNFNTSDRIVAYAQVKNSAPADNYTYFEAEFDYDSYTTPFDEELMKGYKYYFSLVFAASKDGAQFSGADGSLLMIDEVKIEVFE